MVTKVAKTVKSFNNVYVGVESTLSNHQDFSDTLAWTKEYCI